MIAVNSRESCSGSLEPSTSKKCTAPWERIRRWLFASLDRRGLSRASCRKACSAIRCSRFSLSCISTYWIAISTMLSVSSLRDCGLPVSLAAISCSVPSMLAQNADSSSALRSTNCAKVSVMRSWISLK
ncbi:hypothetical protein D9M70_557180 [compost metagenome]